MLAAEHCARRLAFGSRGDGAFVWAWGNCDLCHALAAKPFASVILSSVGVSLHLLKARLLPTDGVLCDIPRRLCERLATAQSLACGASLWPVSVCSLRAPRGC